MPSAITDPVERRCHLCAANDEEAVAERLAEDLWKNRDGRP
jgi:hypothetical protein